MKITKFAHCCLLIEESGLRILTDPGIYSSEQNNLQNIDVVVITHEHQDHFHLDSLKEVMENNPKAKIVSNKVMGDLIEAQGFDYDLVEAGGLFEFKGIRFEGFGTDHAAIYMNIPGSKNTGFLIAQKFFIPGDAFTVPKKEVEVLALPVDGPWMKLGEAIEYAIKVKPKVCFPIHDAMLKIPGAVDKVPSMVLPQQGIAYEPMNPGDSKDF